jgi:hypothetical protein
MTSEGSSWFVGKQIASIIPNFSVSLNFFIASPLLNLS